MAKRKAKNVVPAADQTDPAAHLREALAKRSKAELADVLLEMAQKDRGVLRQLNERFDVTAADGELVAATRQAIADATDFDEREINHNFTYDFDAYEEVKRNFSRLVDSGHLRPAMQLALELMKEGSHQVESSDEGMMTADIEGCLGVVLRSLKECDLPAEAIIAWCSAMIAADRVGFIANDELESLRSHWQRAGR